MIYHIQTLRCEESDCVQGTFGPIEFNRILPWTLARIMSSAFPLQISSQGQTVSMAEKGNTTFMYITNVLQLSLPILLIALCFKCMPNGFGNYSVCAYTVMAFQHK